MAKQPSTAIAVIEELNNFPALAEDQGKGLEILRENVGNSLTQFDFSRIKIPAGGGTIWEIPTLSGTSHEEVIEGVICYWREARAYWEVSYDESGGGGPPDCSSQDCQIGQGNPGGECHKCPLAQFGSADKGGGQACKQMRLLFVLRPGRRLPAVIAIPPTSLKNARNYFLGLVDENCHYSAAVTAFGLEKDRSATGHEYSKVVLRPVGLLAPAAAKASRAYADMMKAGLDGITLGEEDFNQVNPGGAVNDPSPSE